jgi:FMN reductase
LALTRHVGARLSSDGFTVGYLNLREIPAEDLLWGRIDSPAIQAACALVEQADGIVLVTPVYKAAYSGVLKTFLDVLPQVGLGGKVALPLAIGGSLAHMLVIDYAIRPVLISMGGPHVVGGVFLLDGWLRRTESGGLLVDQQVNERLEGSLREFSLALHGRPSVSTSVQRASSVG